MLSEILCVTGTQMERILYIVKSFSHIVSSQQPFSSLFELVLNYDFIKYFDFIWEFSTILTIYYTLNQLLNHIKKLWLHNYPMKCRNATSKEEKNSGSYVSENPKYLMIHRVT